MRCRWYRRRGDWIDWRRDNRGTGYRNRVRGNKRDDRTKEMRGVCVVFGRIIIIIIIKMLGDAGDNIII